MSLFCPECHASYADESMGSCPNDGVRLYRVDDEDPMIGAVIDGRFRVDYTLGIGGMGTVYGGVQLSVNRDVAIKVLRAELSNREVALERFFREAKTISGLAHPNIVKLVDFGQDRERDVLYLVMELVRGQNLGDILRTGRLRTSLALEVIYQVCGALTEPHAAGVIHRDLKPDNLLLVGVSDGTLQTKVLDFGIARFMESNTQLTGTGMICGTPAYMAPEQAQNEQLDERTDLYALGVILYEMLSGWPPFAGTSSLQVMLKHIQENPPSLRELLPKATLPEELEDLVYRLMAKERSRRPANAFEVRNMIDSIRAKLAIEPVRVDLGATKDIDERLSRYVLPKLPKPNYDKSGPTQVLRRETGLELASLQADEGATSVYQSETEADARLGVTGPLTPEGRASVAGDAAQVKVQTRGGAQQAWTPGAQGAVRSIKQTKDVDVMGQTIDAPSAEQPVRHTLVESDDSAPLLDLPQHTEETLEAPHTGEQLAARPSGEATVERDASRASGNTRLVALLVACTIATVGAATVVVNRLDQVMTKTAASELPTFTAAPPVVPSPFPAAKAPADPEVDSAQIAEKVAAQVRAQVELHDAFDAAQAGSARAAKPAFKPKTSAAKQSEEEKQRKTTPPVSPKPDIDSKIRNLLKDDKL